MYVCMCLQVTVCLVHDVCLPTAFSERADASSKSSKFQYRHPQRVEVSRTAVVEINLTVLLVVLEYSLRGMHVGVVCAFSVYGLRFTL